MGAGRIFSLSMGPAQILAVYEQAARPDYWPQDRDRVAAYLQAQLGDGEFERVGDAIGRWRRLEFDSEIFGLPMGRIDWVANPCGTAANRDRVLRQLVAAADAAGIEQLSFRLSAGDVPLLHASEACGFRAMTVFTGLARSPGAEPAPADLRAADGGDRPALRVITAEAFAQGTRFHLDPRLAFGAGLLHRRWIDNCLAGKAADRVLVAAAADEVVGYITGQVDALSGEQMRQLRASIGLFAVRADWRGRGVGGKLLRGLLAALGGVGVEWVEVGTEATNCTAINAYIRTGFKVVQSCITLHRWRRPAA